MSDPQFVFQTLPMSEDEDFYNHTIKNTSSQDTDVTEELFVHVLAPELEDKKPYSCNMCGNLVERSVCLHYVKDWEAKTETGISDVVEEEIILCKDCLDKLAKLLHLIGGN